MSKISNIKKILMIILSILIIPCTLMFAGCSNSVVSISSIAKTSTNGLIDTYTIYYSDGSTGTFTITNGADGKDGTDADNITAQELYDYYKTVYGDISYDEFLEKYLSLNVDAGASAINKCLQSCLKVYTEFTETATTSGYFPQTTKAVAIYTGGAVICKMDSAYTYIITNYHVVYDIKANSDNGSKIARNIYAYLYGSEDEPTETSTTSGGYKVYDYGDSGIKCTYIGGSITNDIAVLRANTSDVKSINNNAKAVTLAENYYVGQSAIAIGNPESEGISVTQGVVSIDNEYISLSIDGTSRNYRSIRIDTPLYAGNSGGGLFNTSGELIGIANAGNSDDQNINYAVPLNIAKGTADSIIYYYNDSDSSTNGAYKITLGVTVTSNSSKYVYDDELGYGQIVEEIAVSSITTGSITSIMGLQKDDIIKSFTINGTEYKINRYFEIGDLLLTIRAGDTIKFSYTRNSVASSTSSYIVLSGNISSVD